MSIRSTEVDAPYRIRIAWGESYAAAVAAGAFTEATFLAVDKKAASVPVEFFNPRVSAGSKVFMACWASGIDTATIDFTLSLHEYD